MDTEKIIEQIFPITTEKKLKRYRDAPWAKATGTIDTYSIPEDAFIYFKEEDHFLWSICSFFFEYKRGMVKGVFL